MIKTEPHRRLHCWRWPCTARDMTGRVTSTLLHCRVIRISWLVHRRIEPSSSWPWRIWPSAHSTRFSTVDRVRMPRVEQVKTTSEAIVAIFGRWNLAGGHQFYSQKLNNKKPNLIANHDTLRNICAFDIECDCFQFKILIKNLNTNRNCW